MAFFKFRWPSQKPQDGGKGGRAARPAKAESIDAMRRRARHRLMGAAVLIVLGVVGFPMLFDTQPRPIPIDTPIEIPDRNKVAPLVVPAEAPRSAGAAVPVPGDRSGAVAGSSLEEGEEIVPSRPVAAGSAPPSPAFVPQVRPEPKAVPKPEARPDPKPEPKAGVRPEPKAPPKPAPADVAAKPEPSRSGKASASSDEAARAKALLEGRSAPTVTAAAAPTPRAAAQEGRFIVQVGAFADAAAAREVQEKLQRAGFKTYTQMVNTQSGKRTRVRVGPIESRAEADRAAARVKSLGLAASVQTL